MAQDQGPDEAQGAQVQPRIVSCYDRELWDVRSAIVCVPACHALCLSACQYCADYADKLLLELLLDIPECREVPTRRHAAE